MALIGHQRALITTRVGAARVGAVRVAFSPKDTASLTPGSTGSHYIWRRSYLAAPNWTAVKR